MTPNRPYLLRALNEWILDNDMTPHIVVDAKSAGVEVPSHFIDNGKIVLNISPIAVRGLEIVNDQISFSARFGGNPYQIKVPVQSVLAIYAKENGKGMIFHQEEYQEDVGVREMDSSQDKKPHLKIVK